MHKHPDVCIGAWGNQLGSKAGRWDSRLVFHSAISHCWCSQRDTVLALRFKPQMHGVIQTLREVGNSSCKGTQTTAFFFFFFFKKLKTKQKPKKKCYL